jgi:nitrate/TMAO reductase-like tetraheme cytochrome c subunit
MPSLTDAKHTGVSTDSLLIGRNLYVNHCGSCHNLHLPEQYTRAHWEKEMPEMQRKAKISDEETRLITKFLLVRSKPE